jgi:hypothetical protein
MKMTAGQSSATSENQSVGGQTCSKLTTCQIAADGQAMRLHFLDGNGQPTFLELPHDQAQALVMTLPHLLTAALQIRTGNANARYVFPLEHWAFELADIENNVLLTLRTTDGFDTCFSVRPETCQQIGTALYSAADIAAEATPVTTPRH